MYRSDGGKILTMDDAQRAALRAKYESPALILPAPSWLRSPQAGLWAVVLILLLAYVLSLRTSLQRSDDFYKVIGAWSLASGRGYCDISRPDAPFLTKYAPLPSLIMAPLMGLVGDYLRPLRLLSMLCYLASMPLVYHLLMPRAGHQRTLLVMLLAGLNPLTLRALNFEGNLGLMVLCMVGAIALIEAPADKQRGRTGLWIGILLALSFYCHRIGIVFGIGSSLYLWFVTRERRLALQTALVFIALSLPWIWRSYAVSSHWISPEYEEEIQRFNGISSQSRSATTVLKHMLSELQQLPSELGYRLFPWSRASGGAPWPFLQTRGLTWTATLSEWTITGLVLIGWGSVVRARRFSDLYLILHTLMLLVFFFGLQYFLPFYPWLYLFLAEGARKVLGKLWSRSARLCYVVILLALLGKNTKAFWLIQTNPVDQDMRWAWIARVVPENEAVYYLGLDNYGFSQLRYFDSGHRMAVGITEAELEKFVASPPPQAHWLCLPRTSPWNERLAKSGWQPATAEPDFIPSNMALMKNNELSAAQKAFLESIAPPQALWQRR